MKQMSNSFVLEGQNKNIAIIAIHGFTVSPDYMKDIAKDINQKGFTVYAPLLAGHGVTKEYLSNFTYHDWIKSAKDGVEFLKSKGYKKIIAVGHSLGGLLSLYLAENNLVDGVVAITAPYYITRYKKILLFSTFFKKKYAPMGDGQEGLFRYNFASGKSISQMVKAIKFIRKSLSNINCSALIVSADNDNTVEPISGKIIFDRISSKDKEYVEIHSGHQCTTSERWQYMNKVINFIEKFS